MLENSSNSNKPFFGLGNQASFSKFYANKFKGGSTEFSHYDIILRTTPKVKYFSFKVPRTWTVDKLLLFIRDTFKSEIDFSKNSATFLYQGTKLTLASHKTSKLSDVFKEKRINQIICTVNKRESNEHYPDLTCSKLRNLLN